MYIRKIVDENIGPIKNINISFAFNSDGTPKPIVLVGENGSGKSTLLSNIVDAFYEMAGKAFDNAWETTENGGHQYYKAISTSQITVGNEYMYSYISFDDEKTINYVLKSGKLSTHNFTVLSGYAANSGISWEENENYKNVDIEEKKSKNIYNKDVICFFGPDRYEKPNWMGEKYYISSEYEHLSIHEKWSRHLQNPIVVKNVTATNLQWLMDVIADSRADIEGNIGNLQIAHITVNDLLLLSTARKNLETIMSKILGKEVYFGLNLRSQGSSRFNIRLKADNSIIVPTLDSLSTGQIALFNMFSTIVRYADRNDLNKSIRLENITGIVVVDEIELHLHTSLQREVVPELIKLFPKVQFIITTHAPLFLLGMEELFGTDNYEIYQMPTATKINVESFVEFRKAYKYFTETQTYQQEVRDAIDNNCSKALLITEGSTDWKHMLSAYRMLSAIEEYSEIFENMEFEFLEYEPKNSKDKNALKLEMGCSQLCTMCENYAKLKQSRKLIFIADRDDKNTNKKFQDGDLKFKNWGNNVYSLILPLPKHRESTPEICIEHYYKDEEIKTTIDIDGIERRLYMGNEFDEKGINYSKDIFCEKRNVCGPEKINIIEGSSGERVVQLSDSSGPNLALSKMEFATKIFEQKAPFDKFDFSSFLPLFKIVKEILNLPIQ